VEETIAMDGRTFDAWTRRLAAGLPRRGALKAIAGAAVGVVATRAVVSDAAACLEDGQFCSTNDECCGVCISFNCTDCVPKGGQGCEGDHDCCGGKLECDNGVCKKRRKNEQSTTCESRGCKKKKKKKKH
jgi:hypothetical protein